MHKIGDRVRPREYDSWFELSNGVKDSDVGVVDEINDDDVWVQFERARLCYGAFQLVPAKERCMFT